MKLVIKLVNQASADPHRAMFKNNIKIFSGNAHVDLAANIAKRLGTTLEKSKVDHFLNKETQFVAFSPFITFFVPNFPCEVLETHSVAT